jgi:hypothetical protein
MRYGHGIDMQSLRWFQLVADGATVTGVAELHLVSQPGVSRALARLEEEVGSPLLLRIGRMLRATHAGMVFKRHVDAALHSFDDGLAAVEQLIDPETGSVSIVFQLSLGTWLVPDLVRPWWGCRLSNQRESVVCWERSSGRPLGPVLGWQDARTAAWCADLAAKHPHAAAKVRSSTGLSLDPMFSAPKMRHALDATTTAGAASRTSRWAPSTRGWCGG